MADSEVTSEKKPKNTRPQAFTHLNAKQAQEASVRSRNLRKQMRAQILDAAIKEGIDKYFVKALKSMDLDAIAVVEKAMKLVGLDYASSEESVQKLDIKSDNKVDAKINIAVTGIDG